MACEQRAWSIATWPKDNPEGKVWAEYECRNWRHAGECARWVSQRDFARVREALKACHVANLVLVVLTLDPSRCPESLDEQYRGLQPRWQEIQKYLTRGWIEGGVPALGKFQFVTTVEAHRSGRPHMNVIIHSRELAQLLRAKPATEADVKARRGPRWFRNLAAHVGWGGLAFIGHATSKDDVASYVTKMDKGQATPSLEGEVVKNSQLPIMAPRRMRRVRCSKGFLPPARLPTNPEWTGGLKQMPTPALQAERAAEAYRTLFNGAVQVQPERPAEPVILDAETRAFRLSSRGHPVWRPVPSSRWAPQREAQRGDADSGEAPPGDDVPFPSSPYEGEAVHGMRKSAVAYLEAERRQAAARTLRRGGVPPERGIGVGGAPRAAGAPSRAGGAPPPGGRGTRARAAGG